MENQDVSFMQNLSSRLSAYSIEPDDPVPVRTEPEPDEHAEQDDTDSEKY